MKAMMAAMLLTACVALPACASLFGGDGPPPAPEQEAAWDAAAEGVVGAIGAASPPAGAIAAGLFAAYQLARKRSRERWVNAAKAVTPHPGDWSVRLGDAVSEIDKALGGGHTSEQPT